MWKIITFLGHFILTIFTWSHIFNQIKYYYIILKVNIIVPFSVSFNHKIDYTINKSTCLTRETVILNNLKDAFSLERKHLRWIQCTFVTSRVNWRRIFSHECNLTRCQTANFEMWNRVADKFICFWWFWNCLLCFAILLIFWRCLSILACFS